MSGHPGATVGIPTQLQVAKTAWKNSLEDVRFQRALEYAQDKGLIGIREINSATYVWLSTPNGEDEERYSPRQFVAHHVRDVGVAGSNPATPTNT